MTLDFWGLGLQAVNVLILVWLLSRVFWRPVAAAIAARQEATRAMLDKAEAAQNDAKAALAEATSAREGIEDERAETLERAKAEAEAATRAALAEAATRADAMRAAASAAIAHDRAVAAKANAAQAAALSLDIAAKLLGRLNGPGAQSAFLDLMVKAIADLPKAERAALAASPDAIDIVSATELGDEKAAIKGAVHKALGGKPALRFVTDPALLAGLELRTAHFTLHNSWQADLANIAKAVKDAA